MKQVLQSLRTGTIELAEVPCPALGRGQLLVQSSRTLLSAGTERMLVEFGKAGWIQKAIQQPEKVRMVFEKIQTDGVMPTIEAVFNKLDSPLPLGYCNVGRVAGLGGGISGFSEGDRIVSNGKHAEMVCVPANLCARIPHPVDDETAAFTVLGSIALQGIRLAKPTIGEAVVVVGLGLIGLLAVQILKANGCRVLGVDFDPAKLALAEQFGAETASALTDDVVARSQIFSRGRGVDAVLITASTKSSEPMHQAALMCRKRGRIVLVGVTGLELSRADFYEKELSFQVSCSYGPGRYDPSYEEKGIDYPIGYVRWTEQRNFEAVLDMMAEGKIDVRPLISHRFEIENAHHAYDLLGNSAPSLGILLEYAARQSGQDSPLRQRTIQLSPKVEMSRKGLSARVAFIGCGNYAKATLIPAFQQAGAKLVSVAATSGVSGFHAGRKFGFESATTDLDTVFSDSQIDAVIISTRHDSHADLTVRALNAGKHVFVEKPLALSREELSRVKSAYEQRDPSRRPILMVGFNRRFSPHIRHVKNLLQAVHEPKAFIMTVNAGSIPIEHWTQDAELGGGRLIGEACHFVDLLRHLAGSSIEGFHVTALANSAFGAKGSDRVNITLRFADGSMGTIHYLANGHKSFPKERLEIFAAGRILQLDNFRRLKGYGWPKMKKMNLWRQDKGQKACAAAFLAQMNQEDVTTIPFDELMEVSLATIEMAESLR